MHREELDTESERMQIKSNNQRNPWLDQLFRIPKQVRITFKLNTNECIYEFENLLNRLTVVCDYMLLFTSYYLKF